MTQLGLHVVERSTPKVAWRKQLRTANASPTRTEFPAIVGAEKIQLRHGGGSVRQLQAPRRDHAMDESTRLITSNHVLNPIISNHHFASMSCHAISIPIRSRVGSNFIGFTTKTEKLSPLSAQVTKRES